MVHHDQIDDCTDYLVEPEHRVHCPHPIDVILRNVDDELRNEIKILLKREKEIVEQLKLLKKPGDSVTIYPKNTDPRWMGHALIAFCRNGGWDVNLIKSSYFSGEEKISGFYVTCPPEIIVTEKYDSRLSVWGDV